MNRHSNVSLYMIYYGVRVHSPRTLKYVLTLINVSDYCPLLWLIWIHKSGKSVSAESRLCWSTFAVLFYEYHILIVLAFHRL